MTHGPINIRFTVQGDSGGKFNTLGGDNIGHQGKESSDEQQSSSECLNLQTKQH